MRGILNVVGRLGRGLGIAVALLALIPACSGTPQVKAYKASAYTVHAVKAAMLAFNDAYQAGQFTEKNRLDVIAAYEKYRAAMKAAIQAQRLLIDAQGEALPDQILPNDIQVLAADLVGLIEQLKGGAK